jgi:hypothetical protein
MLAHVDDVTVSSPDTAHVLSDDGLVAVNYVRPEEGPSHTLAVAAQSIAQAATCQVATCLGSLYI